jgi:hypothetical protein
VNGIVDMAARPDKVYVKGRNEEEAHIVILSLYANQLLLGKKLWPISCRTVMIFISLSGSFWRPSWYWGCSPLLKSVFRRFWTI